MRPPGFLAASWLVAVKELRLEWRTLDTLSASLIFSLVVLVVFSFAFGLDGVEDLGAARLVPGAIWTVMAFAAVVGMSRAGQHEHRNDTLTALFLAPIDRGALYLGKALANWIRLNLLGVVVLALTALLFHYDLPAIAPGLAIVLLAHGLGLVLLGTLFAAVSARVGRGEALVATLLFPAATPLLISAVKCTAALLERGSLGSDLRWLRLTAGLDLLYLFAALWTFEFVLEE